MVTTLLEPVVDEEVTRRGFLAGLASAGVLVAGCGGGATSADAGWRFTDDRGVELTLEPQPQRIVAYDLAASALWHLGITPVGIFGNAPLTDDNPNLFGVDLTGIESVDEVYGEVNLEKVLGLRPDLIVTVFYSGQPGPVFGFADERMQQKAQAIAPIVALDGIKDPIEVIGRFEELAESLGADLEAPALRAAHERFDEAREELRAAIAGKPGLRAVALYATPDAGILFARPAAWPGLRQFQQLGLDLIDPERAPGDTNEYQEAVSWEQADKYPANLILFDRYGDLDALADVATWRALPAVQAQQIALFRPLENWSYPAYTEDFAVLTDAVKRANPDLVP